MSARRWIRLKTVVLMVLSLLFSQLALASYVCPSESKPSTMADMMATGVPCNGTDGEQPVLCHQHATDPARLFDPGHVVALPVPAVVRVLVLHELVDDGSAAVALPRASKPEAQPPPDPIFLSTLRLRV